MEIKYGEDPILTKQYQQYHSTMTPNKKEQEAYNSSAKRHRQQAARYKQKKTELQRKLDESHDGEQKIALRKKKRGGLLVKVDS